MAEDLGFGNRRFAFHRFVSLCNCKKVSHIKTSGSTNRGEGRSNITIPTALVKKYHHIILKKIYASGVKCLSRVRSFDMFKHLVKHVDS